MLKTTQPSPVPRFSSEFHAYRCFVRFPSTCRAWKITEKHAKDFASTFAKQAIKSGNPELENFLNFQNGIPIIAECRARLIFAKFQNFDLTLQKLVLRAIFQISEFEFLLVALDPYLSLRFGNLPSLHIP